MVTITKSSKHQRSPEEIKMRKLGRMEKKAKDLNKRYPMNKYEIKEMGKVLSIIRVSGKAPAKIKKEAAKKRS